MVVGRFIATVKINNVHVLTTLFSVWTRSECKLHGCQDAPVAHSNWDANRWLVQQEFRLWDF